VRACLSLVFAGALRLRLCVCVCVYVCNTIYELVRVYCRACLIELGFRGSAASVCMCMYVCTHIMLFMKCSGSAAVRVCLSLVFAGALHLHVYVCVYVYNTMY
jgi:hypothetical protein